MGRGLVGFNFREHDGDNSETKPKNAVARNELKRDLKRVLYKYKSRCSEHDMIWSLRMCCHCIKEDKL